MQERLPRSLVAFSILGALIAFFFGWKGSYIAPIALASVALLIVYAMRERRWMEIAIACVPLSQAVPVTVAGKEIGFTPEYVLLPLLGFFFLLHKIRNNDLHFHKSGLVTPFVCFLAIAGASLLNSGMEVDFTKTIAGIGTLYVAFLSLIAFVLVYESIENTEKVRAIVFAIILASIAVSLYGFVEYLTQVPKPGSILRIRSFFGPLLWKEGASNPNTLGTYLAIVIILSIGVRREFLGVQRRIIDLSVVLAFIALILSASRSGLVATVVAGAILAIRRDRRVFLAAIPFLAAVTYGLSTIPRAWDRLTSMISIVTHPEIIKYFLRVDPAQFDWGYAGFFGFGKYGIEVVAGAFRFATWAMGVKLFAEHPLLGVGLQMGGSYGGFPTAENLWLDVAMMTGVLGLLPFLWWVRSVIRIAAPISGIQPDSFTAAFTSSYRIILIAIFITTMTGSVMFTMKLVLFFWILTGLQCALKKQMA